MNQQDIKGVFTNEEYHVCDIHNITHPKKKLIVLSDDMDDEPLLINIDYVDTLILINMNLLDTYIPETKVLVLINCQRGHFASSYEEDPYYSCAPSYELVVIDSCFTGEQRIDPYLRLHLKDPIDFGHKNLISLDQCREYEVIKRLGDFTKNL